MLARSPTLALPGRLLLIMALGLFALLAVSVLPVQANEPTERPAPNGGRGPEVGEENQERGEVRLRRRAAEPTQDAQPTPAAQPTTSPAGGATTSPQANALATGWDISYPQCGEPYPEPGDFTIIGVNGGRVYSANPCLGAGEHPSQLLWAGEDVELYINTGNPGPRYSSYWPLGQDEPMECRRGFWRGSDNHECAHVYGWNAAAHSYRTALDAFISVGWLDTDATSLPSDITWWLDVEVANTWRSDRSLNVATLQGAVAYLESMGAEDIGFYSTPRLWNRIVGGTDAFNDYPAWHGGARDLEDAEQRCASERAFTGGELRMVQWIEDGFDANIRCP